MEKKGSFPSQVGSHIVFVMCISIQLSENMSKTIHVPAEEECTFLRCPRQGRQVCVELADPQQLFFLFCAWSSESGSGTKTILLLKILPLSSAFVLMAILSTHHYCPLFVLFRPSQGCYVAPGRDDMQALCVLDRAVTRLGSSMTLEQRNTLRRSAESGTNPFRPGLSTRARSGKAFRN